MKIPQVQKDRIQALVDNDQPFTPYLRPLRIEVASSDDGYRTQSRVLTMRGMKVVYAEDCAELAFFFKRLGKKLGG